MLNVWRWGEGNNDSTKILASIILSLSLSLQHTHSRYDTCTLSHTHTHYLHNNTYRQCFSSLIRATNTLSGTLTSRLSLSLSLSMTHTYLLHLSSFSPRFLHCQSVPKLCDPGDLSACTLTPPVRPSTPHPPPDRLRDGSARWFRLRKK